jgi:L-alanine-DL-glutamate epimerase-like enolase superfamily enzyme
MITVSADVFPLKNPFTISRGSKTEARVVTATVMRGGQRGRGEGVPYPRYGETVEDAIGQATGPAGRDHPAGAARRDATRRRAQCAGLRALGSGGQGRRPRRLAIGWSGCARASRDRLHPVAGYAGPDARGGSPRIATARC